MQFTSLKVFGERNTGTNFLNSFLRLNTSLKVLRGGDGDRKEIKKQFRNFVDSHNITDSFAKRLVMESLLDQESLKRRQKNFGWKHANVCPKVLSKLPKFENVFFIFIVRNPWRFISSLHQKPYNLLPRPDLDISKFIKSSIYTNQRDQLDGRLLKSPVELWNYKVRSYFEFNAVHPGQSLIVYYENLVISPEEFVGYLNRFCAVNKKIVIPKDSSKKHRGDSKKYADFCHEILSYNPREILGDDIFSLITAQLDQDLLAETPYSKYLDI